MASPIQPITPPNAPNISQLISIRQKRDRQKHHTSRISRCLAFLKTWFWRLTATWLLIRFILVHLHERGIYTLASNYVINFIVKVLFHLACTPANWEHFSFAIKLGWLLFITGFSFWELISFLFFYTPAFPLVALFTVFKKNTWRAEMQGASPKRGLTTTKWKIFGHSRAILCLLCLWVLLYSGSNNKFPIALGCFLAALFLLEQAYSAFTFARPIEIKNYFVQSLADSAEKHDLKDSDSSLASETKNKIQLTLLWLAEKFLYYFALKITWVCKGTRGRNLIAMLILFQYLFNISILCVSTVTLWALIIRLNNLSQGVSLNYAFYISISRVVPGLTIDPNVKLKWWIEAGSSMSAWVFFVVYAGPAASVFPMIQQTYVDAISEAYPKLRKATVSLMTHLRVTQGRLCRLEQSTSKPK